MVLLTGCASLQSHNETARKVQAAGQQGDFQSALRQLDERNNTEDAKKELLYNMEKGELLRLNKQYTESTQAYLAADAKVAAWEDAAKTNPQKLLGTLGAALVSERIKVYEGQDYEKVWLTTRIALNRIGQLDLDKARVDIKRTHEREAVIAEFRGKEALQAEEEAKAKGAAVRRRELNGYPVESLNDPEVLALRNGYQNALSHYLAGFLYEVLNEPGLAAPGYRKAIELIPDSPVLEEGLRGLDERTSFTWKRKQRMTDVLFVVEAGTAPARIPRAFTLPVSTGNSLRTVSISYPTIQPSKDPPLYRLQWNDNSLHLSKVVDLNVMARRALKDEMPGLVLRGITRAIAKGAMQKELENRAGPWGGLIGAVISVATEQADDRMWRMLPGRVYLARAHLPPGEHTIKVAGRSFGKVKIEGQYALVPLRLYENLNLIGEVASLGKLPDVAQAPPPATSPVEVKPVPAAGSVEGKTVKTPVTKAATRSKKSQKYKK